MRKNACVFLLLLIAGGSALAAERVPLESAPVPNAVADARMGLVAVSLSLPAGGHEVDLTCTPAGTGGQAVGFVFLVATVSGGPYTQVGSQQTACSLADTLTQFVEGKTYYYVARAVNGGGKQSGNSNEAPALIPFLPCDPPTLLPPVTK
jgi:hypothetical protein